MPIFKYQPYYKYNGVTSSQPFRIELDSEDVQFNITQFCNDLHNYFNDIEEVYITQEEDGFVSINANITQIDCDERVKNCLNSLDLFANRIPAN
ncbi:hypothetical protein [Aliarcobacter butzleri]|uniref:hypothetical protein n=1 Tax=Aliarcobacter butzleri TaxID=28197 RepID=UPI001260E4FD|nr:hypothetical protein [Aliarcobacter butzleri]